MKLFTNKIVRLLGISWIAVLSVGKADAVIVVGGGVDLIDTKHYVINSEQSSVSFTSGTLVFPDDGSSAIQTYDLAGSFDAEMKRYWWDYYLDGDTDGSQGTFTYSTNWLELVKPSLIADGLSSEFRFPNFPSFMNTATEFFGSNNPCALPLGPDTFCSGSSFGESSLTGQLQGTKILINGTQPDVFFSFGGGYTYHIEAAVVPVPAAFWLFFSGLSMLVVRRR
ncbi:hypothetical protein IVG45_17915 [Methylomonas sp. LL1]|uniref:hypothetical protein n=1 Tax=Methylomonas sp. LL1 TaxID=2785785 RepID=UPI0018C3D786|nr:hypothetical protein [Methylomonas sp. LL1]QPK62695.1 hypothetical protein IVG45_17915 [Methylomonas sp. LL1]